MPSTIRGGLSTATQGTPFPTQRGITGRINTWMKAHNYWIDLKLHRNKASVQNASSLQWNASVVTQREPWMCWKAGRWRRPCVVSGEGNGEALLRHLSCAGPGPRRAGLALMETCKAQAQGLLLFGVASAACPCCLVCHNARSPASASQFVNRN